MTALNAFLGSGLTHVKVSNIGRITVDFGRIEIPYHLVGEYKKDSIEEEHNCLIKQLANHVIVIPRFVKDRMFISTDDDELKKELENWFREHSKIVVMKIIKS
jgi:hypothetical protein